MYFTTLLACFSNVDQAVIKSYIPKRSWYVVGHFEKYLYLFIQSSHFVRGICLPEVDLFTTCMNVAIMLWRCFLTTFSATLWQHS